MSSTEVTALINLIIALLPTIEKGAVALYADISTMIAAASASTDATPEQITALAGLSKQSDAAQDAAVAAYDAQGPA